MAFQCLVVVVWWRAVTHNHARSLKEIEIIVVDDGSTDSTYAICNQMREKDKRISIIKQDNRGPLCARINSIKHSKGDYFLLCDADDYYATAQAIERLALYLNRYSSHDKIVDVIQFDHYV